MSWTVYTPRSHAQDVGLNQTIFMTLPPTLKVHTELLLGTCECRIHIFLVLSEIFIYSSNPCQLSVTFRAPTLHRCVSSSVYLPSSPLIPRSDWTSNYAVGAGGTTQWKDVPHVYTHPSYSPAVLCIFRPVLPFWALQLACGHLEGSRYWGFKFLPLPAVWRMKPTQCSRLYVKLCSERTSLPLRLPHFFLYWLVR